MFGRDYVNQKCTNSNHEVGAGLCWISLLGDAAKWVEARLQEVFFFNIVS